MLRNHQKVFLFKDNISSLQNGSSAVAVCSWNESDSFNVYICSEIRQLSYMALIKIHCLITKKVIIKLLHSI
jgi:hypothetical protein